MIVQPTALRALLLPTVLLACATRGPATEPGCVPDPAAEPVAGPPTTEPGPGAAEAATVDGSLRCLPFATCGCFQQPECVAGRVREDGYTFDIVGGPRDGEEAHLAADCPAGTTDPAACPAYVDPAMICRRLQPADVRSAKYLCATDHLHPSWECGFRDGACTVL